MPVVRTCPNNEIDFVADFNVHVHFAKSHSHRECAVHEAHPDLVRAHRVVSMRSECKEYTRPIQGPPSLQLRRYENGMSVIEGILVHHVLRPRGQAT